MTGISERHLKLSYWGRENHYIRTRANVAEKMSWAAERKTSRLEDEAYCLLGLFGINMPLLYGEGSNAFQRLQMEILRSSIGGEDVVAGTTALYLVSQDDLWSRDDLKKLGSEVIYLKL